MSYEFDVKNGILCLTFSGNLDGLDFIKLFSHADFWSELEAFKKLIVDFSDMEEINMEFNDIRQFAKLANLQSNFIEQMEIVLVLRDPASPHKAVAFRDGLTATGWHIEIVTSFAEAISYFGMSSPGGH